MNEYIPFGEAWEKEIMKMPKKELINLIKKHAIQIDFFLSRIKSLESVLVDKDALIRSLNEHLKNKDVLF